LINAESSVKEALLKVQMSDHRISVLESDLDQNIKVRQLCFKITYIIRLHVLY